MKGDLWQIAVVLVFLALLLPAASIGFEAAEDRETIEDETVILEYDEPVAVEYHEEATDDVPTVTDEDGTELEEGIDYSWDAGNITALETNLDGEPVNVTYEIMIRTEATEDVAQILGIFDDWLAIIFLFVVVGAIVAMSFGGSGGRY